MIEKYLTQIDSALGSFQDKRKMSENVEIVRDILQQTRDLLSGVLEVRTVVALGNQWRQMQPGFASEHNIGVNSFAVTSGISQVVTQMVALKELLNLNGNVDGMFKTAETRFQEMIPEPGKEEPVLVLKKKQVYEISGPVPRKADPPARKSPVPVEETPRKTTGRARGEKIVAKPPRIFNSPKYEAVSIEEQEVKEETDPEIEALQNELEELTEQSNKLADELERSRSQTVEEDPIVPLRMHKRELEEEMIRLDATIQRMVAQMEESATTKAYKENSELRQQRADMNRELLSLRERCLRMNSVLQKAALSQRVETNQESVLDDYQKAIETNEEISARRDALIQELENLERQRDSLLFEKYFGEEAGTSVIEDLLSLKNTYKVKKEENLRKQQKMQSDAALILRRKTELAISKLHQKTMKQMEEPMRMKQELTAQYDELKDAYNDAVTRGEEIIYDDEDGVVTVDDAQETLMDLSQRYAEVVDGIKRINKQEIEAEKGIIMEELSQLERGNEELVKWISQMRHNSSETQAEIQSLTIEYQLLEKSLNDPEFDVESALDEALEKTQQGNEKLNTMLELVMDELAGLDADLGGSGEPMSLEDRLVSISDKLKSVHTSDA